MKRIRLLHRARFLRTPPETRFLADEPPIASVWQGKTAMRSEDEWRESLPLEDRAGKMDYVAAYRADSRERALLLPADPVELLLRHRSNVEMLRTAVGQKLLFEKHVLPALAGWAALVQSIPREARGLWCGTDGFFEAGLAFAQGSLNAADARVLEPSMTPTRRAMWTERVRVAALIAGLLSDSDRFAGIRLEAGTVRPETGEFEPLERFAVGEERALSFGIRHAGRFFRITRLTTGESAGRLPTLGLDFLRLAVPAETLSWLGALERKSGETVLTALKSALMFGTGRTETERLLSECTARGREWAVNRRSSRAAAREGRSPLLEGFAEIFRAVLFARIHDGLWEFNRDDSPLLYAEDGIAMRWPEGFVSIAAGAGEGTFCREIPDEPDVAAVILEKSGVIFSDEAGVIVRRALGREADKAGISAAGHFVRLSESEKIVTLARRSADRRGECLPPKLPPLFDASILDKCGSDDFGILPGRFAWRLAFEERSDRTSEMEALLGAVAIINRRPDAMLFGTVRGLFIPEKLLREGFRGDAPSLDGILLKRRIPGGEFLGLSRETVFHRFRVKKSEAFSLADLSEAGSPEGPFLMTGVLVRLHCVRPSEVWSDGTVSERGFPKGSDFLEFID